ncbi:MAG: hypothetical protein ABL921_11470 [Pirellula sp.]
MMKQLFFLLIWISWGALMCSFCIPAVSSNVATESATGKTLLGWQFMLHSFLLAINPIGLLFEPRWLALIAFPFFNLLAFVSPWLLRFQADRGWHLWFWMFLGGSLPWMAPWSVMGHPLFGFYLWNASYFGLGLGSVLIAMISEQELRKPTLFTKTNEGIWRFRSDKTL